MDVSKHPEYEKEDKRLKNTQKAIDFFVKSKGQQKAKGADEWSSIVLSAHNLEIVDQYQRARQDPYYGRFDFHSEAASKSETIYLGYQSLNLGDYEVIDWRAPICSLFASSNAEEQSYIAPDGEIKGKLLLRRRFLLTNGALNKIMDELDYRPEYQGKKSVPVIQESIQDFLLQELYTRGDPELQDIVKTIQKQQDNIIRSRHDRVVVINGVAGSGKTSIAIHRMAYLLFPGNRTNIKASQSIIFCPNPIFLHYIEDLLPKLGERNVRQTTFFQWALDLMQSPNLKIVDTLHDLIVNPDSDPEALKSRWQSAHLKGSVRFEKVLEKYANYLVNFGQNYPNASLVYTDIGALRINFIFTPDEIINFIEDAIRIYSANMEQARSSAWYSIAKSIEKNMMMLFGRTHRRLKK